MTGATMAGLSLTASLTGEGEQYDWADTLSHRISRPTTAVEAVSANAKVAAAVVGDWVTAVHPITDEPAEGAGVVGTIDRDKVAVSTVGGTTCQVSAICTHLGGLVRFNDLEWTLGLSTPRIRFSADGQVLEGPATRPLPAAEPTRAATQQTS